MSKIASIVLMVMIMGLVLAGCGQSQPQSKSAEADKSAGEQPKQELTAAKPPQQETKQELKKIVISGPSDSIYLAGPIHLAKEKGFYAEVGIDPELVTMPTNTTIAGLMSDEVDYSYAVSSVVNAAAQGMPVKALMGFITSHNWSFMTSPEIKTIEQLKGKTVAIVSKGGSSQQLTSLTLRKLGLDPQRDVNFIAAGPTPQLVATFLGGVFAAALVSEPHASMLKTKGYNSFIFLGDIVNLTGFGLASTEKKLAENPEEVKAVLRAALRGLQFFKEHKDESVEFIARHFKVEKDIARSSYESTLKVMSPDGTITKSQFDSTIDIAREELGLKEGQTLPFEQVVNMKLLEQVQKELGQ